MKLYDWNANVQMERFLFMFFICFLLLLMVNYYYAMIAHKTVYIVNFFAIIFSIKLFCIMADVADRMLKKQIVQLMSMGVFILILSFLPVSLWIIVTVNNFFALVYFIFLHFHRKKSKQKYRFIRSYVSLVHLFYIIYLITLNLQVLLFNKSEIPVVLFLSYLQVGLQIILLIISLTSYLFYSRILRLRKIHAFFGVGDCTVKAGKKQKNKLILQKEMTVSHQVSYKYQEVMEQVLDFFETSDVYLKHDFTLEILGQCISNTNLQVISFVINHHLNSTFYKLVAYHRILYALKLLAERNDWTVLAIAESVGFKSINTFNKYFKDLTGLTPVEYRVILDRKRG